MKALIPNHKIQYYVKKTFKNPVASDKNTGGHKYLFTNILTLLLITTTKLTFAEETHETLTFTVQPINMCLQKDSACTLTCSAECGNSSILYKWYTTNAKGTTKTPITDEWSESPDHAVEPFSEKGIRYYICGATVDQENVVYSDVVAAAYTGLPILNIETVDHEEPTAEYYKKLMRQKFRLECGFTKTERKLPYTIVKIT